MREWVERDVDVVISEEMFEPVGARQERQPIRHDAVRRKHRLYAAALVLLGKPRLLEDEARSGHGFQNLRPARNRLLLYFQQAIERAERDVTARQRGQW